MGKIITGSKRLLTLEDLRKTCRICFTYGNLYDTKTSMYEGHTIGELFCGMINTRINMNNYKAIEELQIEDPQFICFGCITNLISAKLFFDQCSKAYKTLDKVKEDLILNQQNSVMIAKPIYLYRKIKTIVMQRCNLNKGVPADPIKESEKDEEVVKIIQAVPKTTTKANNAQKRRRHNLLSHLPRKKKIHEEDCEDIKVEELSQMTDIDLSDIVNEFEVIKKEVDDVGNGEDILEANDKNELILIKSNLKDDSNDSSGDAENSFAEDAAESDDDEDIKIDRKKKIKDRKKYHCDKCSLDFVGFRPFCRHNRDIHPKSYICNVCKKKFPNCLQLARHRWTHLQVECDICHKKTKKTSFKAHMKTHEKGYKPTPYKNVEKLCPLCGKMLSISSWKDHVDGHTKPKKYKCKLCSFASSFGPSLKRHQAVHTGEKPFLCTDCGYTCNQKIALEKHLNQHAISDTPLICQFCPETFRTRYDRRLHSLQHGYGSNAKSRADGNAGIQPTTKTMYRGPPVRAERNSAGTPNICEICKKTFKSKSKLKEHVLVHTGERPHKCDYCSSAFKQQQQLNAHTMRMHVVQDTYKLFTCDICNRGFKYRQALNAHVLIHTGEKPYKCDMCPSAFRQIPHLITHKQRIHDERKPFCCEFCDKSFKCAFSLKEHIRTHTGETIECEHCEKTFKQSSTKYKHLREVHNIRRSIALT